MKWKRRTNNFNSLMNIGADNAYLRFVIMFILMSITPDLDTLSENLSGINHYGHVNISWFALVSCVLGWLWPFRYFVTGGNGSLSTTSNIIIMSQFETPKRYSFKFKYFRMAATYVIGSRLWWPVAVTQRHEECAGVRFSIFTREAFQNARTSD